ncbi:MAG TPA: hypothetical protein PLB46_04535 [Chitinophagales bacterium]|nr:hypothetical protein [Chitinophagales bacterium]
MDTKITEIEILLDKLNLLFASIKNDGVIDKVEMELLRKYVQQLQDKLNTDSGQKIVPPVVIPVAKVEEVKKEVEKTMIPEIEVPVHPVELPKVEKIDEPIVSKEVNVPITKTPVVEPVINPVKEVEKKVEQIIPPVEIEKQKIVETPVVNKSPEVKPPVSGNDKKPLAILDDEEEEEDFNAGLNNKLYKDKKTLADKLTSSKGKDLKSVIDLNEKLFFINKLFKGDKDAYENTIKQLNQVTSYEAGKQLIVADLANKYNWKDKEAIERLTEVIQQKFM